MTRTKIAFLVAAALAFTLTVQGANSASLTATGALKESAAGSSLVQKAHHCHTTCRYGRVAPGAGRACHRNVWSCTIATPCDPKACRWWYWWHH
jgi:hypothetical protein